MSVTDRCNLRCTYCMPRAVFGGAFRFMERGELLSYEEITRVARIAAGLGVDKIRLTGGEPLLRRDLHRLVAALAEVEGLRDISLTTNGVLLARHAEQLARAGLQRVTVSLDSLDERVFAAMSDARVSPARVLEGIEAAQEAGLSPVKVNMVVRRGVNDDGVVAMAEHFRGTAQILRFIEYMDVGETNGWRREDVVPASDILAAIGARWPLAPLQPTRAGEVATRFRYSDGGGEIGVIASITQPFCGGCSRARLSADGKLYTCLFAAQGHDLRALLRAGAGDAEIATALNGIWSARSDRYSERRAARASAREARQRVEMSYIGG